jgi:hypothetical protein
MKRTITRPFYARFLASQDMESTRGGRVQAVEPPRFVTLKAGKCGNDCDSDVDSPPEA